MAGIFSNLRGVLADLFQIGGPTGVNLKENSGVLEARDSGDTAFVIVRGDDPVGLNDLVTKGYGDANYGGALQDAYNNGATITTAAAAAARAGPPGHAQRPTTRPLPIQSDRRSIASQKQHEAELLDRLSLCLASCFALLRCS